MNILGIFHSGSDPSAALIKNGKIIAFIEEERLIRIKHATGRFPFKAIDEVLRQGKIKITDVDYIAQAWDCRLYDKGAMQKHFAGINERYKTDPQDIAYQNKHLSFFKSENQKKIIYAALRKQYGDVALPPITFVNHHFAHAISAYLHSGFDKSLVMTIDGSGEWTTTAWWQGENQKLSKIHEIKTPHSLGWFYSAFTEYLGFQAYSGEYKVMGLAAYGQEDLGLRRKLEKIIWYDQKGGFETNPLLMSRGKRNFSYYYPDKLATYMGKPPRHEKEEITAWHKNLAFEIQNHLEDIVLKMLAYWTQKTGLRKIAVSGGVGLNVKMNSKIYESGLVEEAYFHPLCSDAGISIGAAMALGYQLKEKFDRCLETIYLGPEYSDGEIEKILRQCNLSFKKCARIQRDVANEIATGKIVGWFQGRMEAGPRALGNRSILASPQDVRNRDRVNAIIKYRELWRPFCPSMIQEGARRYLKDFAFAPYMIVAFRATEAAKKDIPAVVHVDGTCRVQIVEKEHNKIYYELIKEFEQITGIPVLLNTSFNIKGEPMICSAYDAIRTFYSTGLDVLALGPYLIRKKDGK